MKEIGYDELYDLYIVQNKTIIEIAKILGCSDNTVSNYLKKYSVYKKTIISNDELYNLYITQNYSISEISKLYNISEVTISNYLKKYNIHKSKELTIKKIKQTNLEKYGCECPFQSNEVKEKIKQTNLNRYGVDNCMFNEEIKDKLKTTNLDRYGVDCVFKSNIIKEKIEQTNIKKYGHKNILLSGEVKEKIEKTNLERYGFKYPSQNDKIKEKIVNTNLKKLGVEYPTQLESVKEKSKRTCLERYGCEKPTQSDVIKAKNSKILSSKEILEKMYATKDRNHSWNISKPEDRLYEKLIQKYGKNDIIRQYRDERYPFSCDFYIKSRDLFIELNLSWTHGGHPFNSNNLSDIEKLNAWENKNTKYYDNAIETWTVRDPLKLKTAKDNKLNYIVYYNEEEI